MEVYISRLSRENLERLALRLAERLIECEEIRFCSAECPDYQGEFTVNDHFYWRTTGEDLLEKDERSEH